MHGYETDRVQFWKKNPSTCARRTRLLIMSVPALSAARRGRTRPMRAVPVSKPLGWTYESKIKTEVFEKSDFSGSNAEAYGLYT
jgi:hypothetical protein